MNRERDRQTDEEYIAMQKQLAMDHYRKHMATPQAGREPPYTPQPRARVLQQALDLTMGERNATYGDPTDNHNNIARLWRAYVQTRDIALREIDAEDVMIMMALLKIARIGQRLDHGNADSYVDACAYIAMAVEPSIREPMQTEG